MNKIVRNIILFIFPFILLCIVNETVRYSIHKKVFYKVSERINSFDRSSEMCTWKCHASTSHCQMNHVKYLNSYFEYTDPIYYGIINTLERSGKYQLINVIIFVLLLPIMMYFLLIRILDMRNEIKQLKKS